MRIFRKMTAWAVSLALALGPVIPALAATTNQVGYDIVSNQPCLLGNSTTCQLPVTARAPVAGDPTGWISRGALLTSDTFRTGKSGWEPLVTPSATQKAKPPRLLSMESGLSQLGPRACTLTLALITRFTSAGYRRGRGSP